MIKSDLGEVKNRLIKKTDIDFWLKWKGLIEKFKGDI